MLQRIKQDIIKYGKLAGERNLSPGVSGNISVRYGENIVITASGSANGFLEESDISVIDFNGNLVEGTKQASKEKLMHIEFYKKRNDINAICHFHSPYMSAYAITSKAIDENVLPDIIYHFNKIPIAQYSVPGSEKLAQDTAFYFDKYKAVLMANHGYVTGGKDLKEAFLNAETCETYAKTLILSKILGGAKMLNEQQVEEINSMKPRQ